MKTSTAHSSHGAITFKSKSGFVTSYQRNNVSDPESLFLAQIIRFDTAEYTRFYNRPLPPDIDILDLGYWSANGSYEEPAANWRNETFFLRLGIPHFDTSEPFTANEIDELWDYLGTIPVNDDGILQERFYSFPAGTHREEVWSWFEETFNLSVTNLMFHQKM